MSALGSAGATVQTAVNDALVFLLTDTATWSWTQILSLYFGVLFWLEVLSYLLPFLLETDKFSTRLPAAGRRRMRLDVWDYYHIVINKLQIPFFFLTVVRFLYGGGNGLFHSINVVSDVSQLNVLNFAVAIVLQFIVYDFAYSLFHRFLHWPPVYAYVHKHHHRQVAPMRGLDDAINTHWFENFCGMWWHLMSIIIIDRLGFQQHSLSGVMFLVIGSMLSSFNHLSFDTKIPFGLYNASEHLTHHRFSKMNYGAYIQLWDRVFGTYVDWTTPPEITPEQGPVAPDYCSPEACLKEAKKITKDAPKRCVVTGGNGLVGKRLVEMLVERGAKSVLSLDLSLPAVQNSKVTYAVADVCDKQQLLQAFEGADCVFHVAALVGPYFSPKAYDRVNHQGVRNVVSACRTCNVPTMVLTASPSTKMNGDDIYNLSEDQLKVPKPNQYLQEYARTKALGENFALKSNCPELRICAVGPHQVYGPEDKLFLPSIVRAATSGMLRVFGAGDNLISCCQVDNICHAHILAATALAKEAGVPDAKLNAASKVSGEFFVIADGNANFLWRTLDQAVVGCGLPSLEMKFHLNLPILYVAAYISQFLSFFIKPFTGRALRLNPFVVRMLTMHRFFNIDKAVKRLNYRPIRSFEEGWVEAIENTRSLLSKEGLLTAQQVQAGEAITNKMKSALNVEVAVPTPASAAAATPKKTKSTPVRTPRSARK
jgi:nucleoside-diphosphate-sugar epimerase/sterol desaturase/sphingolipid hydroxylase (fatty acid hydroxylase superfamily)